MMKVFVAVFLCTLVALCVSVPLQETEGIIFGIFLLVSTYHSLKLCLRL